MAYQPHYNQDIIEEDVGVKTKAAVYYAVIVDAIQETTTMIARY